MDLLRLAAMGVGGSSGLDFDDDICSGHKSFFLPVSFNLTFPLAHEGAVAALELPSVCSDR